MKTNITVIKILLGCIIFFQLSCYSKRNNTQPIIIDHALLQKDFDILQTTLKEAHPGLYWYTDSMGMERYFDSTKAAIVHNMTSLEFFKLLLPLISNIKCLHTKLRLPDNAAVNQITQVLPFDFICQERKVYIRKGLNNEGYDGAELLSINDIETGKIVETLFNSISGDGYNETFKSNLLTKGAFREGYALYFGQPDRFIIQAKNLRSRQLFKFTVPAISPRNIYSTPITPLPPFLLKFHQNTAILSVNTFELNTKRFTDSIISIFQTIMAKGAKHLIIDIRQNGGGTNDNVSTLYSFIANAPFLHLKRAEMKAASLTYPQFIDNAQGIEEFRRGDQSNGYYEVNDRYTGTKIKNPVHTNLFKGEVVLLTSGYTSSAASEFAAIVHFQKRAKIVGEETRGCYYGANGGNYLNLKLPNSGLKLRIPTIRIYTAVDQELKRQPTGRGTFPDYPILPTVTDLLNDKDVQMEKALKVYIINQGIYDYHLGLTKFERSILHQK